MNHKVYLVTFAALSTSAIGSAYAAEPVENDALAIAGARISLAQAVTTAEQQVSGKASRAKYEHEKDQSVFEVEVVKNKSVMDVKIDPMSGQVIASVEDKVDHEDDE